MTERMSCFDYMERAELEKSHNDVMTTGEMTAKFAVKCFLAPFCYATNRETKEEVVIQFQHDPRCADGDTREQLYFNVRMSGVTENTMHNA